MQAQSEAGEQPVRGCHDTAFLSSADPSQRPQSDGQALDELLHLIFGDHGTRRPPTAEPWWLRLARSGTDEHARRRAAQRRHRDRDVSAVETMERDRDHERYPELR